MTRLTSMRCEDLPMEEGEEHQKRLDLRDEVAQLRKVLENEQKQNQVLQCALQWPLVRHSCLSSGLPLQVKVLLAELAMVEEEIICLERRVADLKLALYRERKWKKETFFQQQQQQQQWWQRQQRNLLCGLEYPKETDDIEQAKQLSKKEIGGQSLIGERNTNLELVKEIKCIYSTKKTDDERQGRCDKPNQNLSLLDEEIRTDTPNRLSEDLVNILISIFHKLNQTSNPLGCASTITPKLHISCMSSRKSSSNCKTQMNSPKEAAHMLHPYGASPDVAGTAQDLRSYNKFIQITQSSFDMSRISLCFPAIAKLRELMHKLCTVELSFLTYKQKLAFWINIYNACVMHAFLQHGIPPSPDKLLGLLNKAAANVGGIVLNALAIEHFILRHSSDSVYGFMDEKEALLRHAYGLGYPEPNVTFALCRGSWSSPALRVYTAEDVVNELERAKVEYLEASVGVTNKKKIIVPKLLHWHMRDFADDVESLVEWIYSQLARSSSLRRMIKECLSGDTKIPLIKMVEIKPSEAEFRYMLPL